MITAIVSEEASQHIFPAKSCFEALKALNDLYDSHSKMEIIHLLSKLFSLEVKNNDPMLVTYEIKVLIKLTFLITCNPQLLKEGVPID